MNFKPGDEPPEAIPARVLEWMQDVGKAVVPVDAVQDVSRLDPYERDTLAWELRYRDHKTFDEIAKELGLGNRSVAKKAVDRVRNQRVGIEREEMILDLTAEIEADMRANAEVAKTPLYKWATGNGKPILDPLTGEPLRDFREALQARADNGKLRDQLIKLRGLMLPKAEAVARDQADAEFLAEVDKQNAETETLRQQVEELQNRLDARTVPGSVKE